MVEVFKTNVTQPDQANRLIELIHETFDGYTANFDLDDCDRILRVKSTNGFIKSNSLITLLRDSGFDADVLPDEEHISSPIFSEFGIGIL